ncbi:MAG: hypothetical protein WBG46_15195 [Nonlabens sp.]
MKYCIAIAGIFLIGLVFTAQNKKWQDKYSQEWRKNENGTSLCVTNNNILLITYVLDYNPVNLSPSIENGSYIVIPGETKDFKVIDFTTIKKGKGWKFKNGGTLVYLGDLTDTEYNEDFIYDLPFEKGDAFKVGQGYNGKFSHQGKMQLDFTVPVNTKIYACRGGTVVAV